MQNANQLQIEKSQLQSELNNANGSFSEELVEAQKLNKTSAEHVFKYKKIIEQMKKDADRS
jgi:hypothetical protein